LQTKGQRQIRFTWQLWVIIGLSLIALALPIASVILALQVLTKRGAPQMQEEAPEASGYGALENVLKGIADEKLTPGELEDVRAKIELMAFDVEEERGRVEGLLKSFGGVAVPTSESTSEIRLLVRVPEDRLPEFLAACLGDGARPPDGDLLEIVIRKRKTP
jgi:hypothetical protein